MTSIAIDRTDGLASSTAVKGPCRAATTANITLYGQQTIDGIAVVSGDRVLVKDQTSAYENGLYVVDTGQWRRARDFDKTNDVREGTLVLVTDGTLSEHSGWCVTSSNPVVVGTDPITFVKIIVSESEMLDLVAQASASAAAAAASAAAAEAAASSVQYNLTVDQFTGDGTTTIFALTADPRTNNNIQVNFSGALQFHSEFNLTYVGGLPKLQFVLAPPAVSFEAVYGNAASLIVPADGSVSTAKIANGAVTAAKLSGVTTSSISEGSGLYFTAARVLATVLAGLSTATNATITAADTILSGLGKLQAQITALALVVPYLNSANTFTNDQTISKTSPALNFDGPAGGNRIIWSRTAGSSRWAFLLANSETETGSNAGSNFSINRYTDAGAFLDTPLAINRATGITTLNGIALATNGAISFSGTGAATTRTNLGAAASASPSITGTAAIANANISTNAILGAANNGAFVSGHDTFQVSYAVASGGGVLQHLNATGANVPVALDMINAAGARSGYIAIAASSTSYATSSDYRLKTVTGTYGRSGEVIDQIVIHDFIWNETGQAAVGSLAHELQSVFPAAVGGEKDEVDAEGNPIYQGVDWSKLVPVLIAEIQSLRRRVSALEV